MDLYMMNCELLATCSALGYLEGDTYHKEPDCLGEYLFEETGKKNLLELQRSIEFLQLWVWVAWGPGWSFFQGSYKCLFCP